MQPGELLEPTKQQLSELVALLKNGWINEHVGTGGAFGAVVGRPEIYSA